MVQKKKKNMYILHGERRRENEGICSANGTNPVTLGEGTWEVFVLVLLSWKFKLDQNKTFQRNSTRSQSLPLARPLTEASLGPWGHQGGHRPAGSPAPADRQGQPGCWAPRSGAKARRLVNSQAGPCEERQGRRVGVGEESAPGRASTKAALTFFILKDSSSSFSTARMFSMGML